MALPDRENNFRLDRDAAPAGPPHRPGTNLDAAAAREWLDWLKSRMETAIGPAPYAAGRNPSTLPRKQMPDPGTNAAPVAGIPEKTGGPPVPGDAEPAPSMKRSHGEWRSGRRSSWLVRWWRNLIGPRAKTPHRKRKKVAVLPL